LVTEAICTTLLHGAGLPVFVLLVACGIAIKVESTPFAGVVWLNSAAKTVEKFVPVPTTAVDPFVTARVPVVYGAMHPTPPLPEQS
jgi:hypothetical protein